MSEHHLILVTTVLSSLLASAGFWAIIERRFSRRSNHTALLLGLAHDRIVELSMKYIERGYLTTDEHENLMEYLYNPYRDEGGNGTAKRLISMVDELPVRSFLINGDR